MVKLTDFSWQGFLGKLSPESVKLLGKIWDIPEWQVIEKDMIKSSRQEIKQWIPALNNKDEDELAQITDQADQIKTVGTPVGREELQKVCSGEWFKKYKDFGCQDLAVKAFIELSEAFREALDWVAVLHAERWECYQAKDNEKVNLTKTKTSALESAIRQHWKDKALGGKCMITSLHRGSVTVIDIGYEEDPLSFREFNKSSDIQKTVLMVAHPVREALLYYDESTGCLKVRLYRGNPQKFDKLVRLTAEICFNDADFFATGPKRKQRYDLDKFKTRPNFLQNIDKSTGLNAVRVVGLIMVPSYLKYGLIEARIPARQAKDENKDAYDVLNRENLTSDWEVIKVSLAAYFGSGRRKILPIELKAKGGSALSGDPRYDIIEKHLRDWCVLK